MNGLSATEAEGRQQSRRTLCRWLVGRAERRRGQSLADDARATLDLDAAANDRRLDDGVLAYGGPLSDEGELDLGARADAHSVEEHGRAHKRAVADRDPWAEREVWP